MHVIRLISPILITSIWLILISCGSYSPKDADQATVSGSSLLSSEPENRQVIVVLTDNWDTAEGALWTLEWKENQWKKVLDSIPVLIGRNGLAWGKGVEDYRNRKGPIKKEGDKKSPAGAFKLGEAFGYADQLPTGDWPYTHVKATTMCIEDGDSDYYNRIIDEGEASSDWNSTDHMLRKDDLYEWGVHVLHNSTDIVGGDGSCIFLHVWRENGTGTAGCTSLKKATLLSMISWLSPENQPIMVQAPRLDWQFLRQTYRLPNL